MYSTDNIWWPVADSRVWIEQSSTGTASDFFNDTAWGSCAFNKLRAVGWMVYNWTTAFAANINRDDCCSCGCSCWSWSSWSRQLWCCNCGSCCCWYDKGPANNIWGPIADSHVWIKKCATWTLLKHCYNFSVDPLAVVEHVALSLMWNYVLAPWAIAVDCGW